MSIALTIVGISVLIVLHEVGHFLVAKACGMRVQRFSVGFGPALISRQFGETTWQLAVIPLGGFVQIEGMGPAEDGDTTVDDPRSYRNKPWRQRFAVILAGPITNWLLAAALLAVLAATVGFRQYDESVAILGELIEGGAAQKDGLREGDEVRGVAGEAVHDWSSFVRVIQAHPNDTVTIEIARGGAPLALQVTPQASPAGGHGVVGAFPHATLQRATWLRAGIDGLVGAWELTARQVGLLVGLATGTQQGELLGIPGIVKMVASQAERGLARLLEQLSWLSIGLCLLNLLPLPALDGGRIMFLGIEAIRRRPVSERVEGWVHGVGFVLLLGLMILVSVRDLL